MTRKNLLLIFLMVIVLSLILFSTPLYRNIKCYLGTKYTTGYSPEKFNQIKVGMNELEVLRLLGEPFVKNVAEGDYLGKNSKKISYDYSFNYHEPKDKSEDYYIKTILIGGGKVVYIIDEFYSED